MGLRRLLFTFGGSVALIVVTVGVSLHLLFEHLGKEERARCFQQLDAIGTLKVGQIQGYARERKADVALVAGILQSSAGQKWLRPQMSLSPKPYGIRWKLRWSHTGTKGW